VLLITGFAGDVAAALATFVEFTSSYCKKVVFCAILFQPGVKFFFLIFYSLVLLFDCLNKCCLAVMLLIRVYKEWDCAFLALLLIEPTDFLMLLFALFRNLNFTASLAGQPALITILLMVDCLRVLFASSRPKMALIKDTVECSFLQNVFHVFIHGQHY
jgi:hypothetical protein